MGSASADKMLFWDWLKLIRIFSEVSIQVMVTELQSAYRHNSDKSTYTA